MLLEGVLVMLLDCVVASELALVLPSGVVLLQVAALLGPAGARSTVQTCSRCLSRVLPNVLPSASRRKRPAQQAHSPERHEEALLGALYGRHCSAALM